MWKWANSQNGFKSAASYCTEWLSNVVPALRQNCLILILKTYRGGESGTAESILELQFPYSPEVKKTLRARVSTSCCCSSLGRSHRNLCCIIAYDNLLFRISRRTMSSGKRGGFRLISQHGIDISRLWMKTTRTRTTLLLSKKKVFATHFFSANEDNRFLLSPEDECMVPCRRVGSLSLFLFILLLEETAWQSPMHDCMYSTAERTNAGSICAQHNGPNAGHHGHPEIFCPLNRETVPCKAWENILQLPGSVPDFRNPDKLFCNLI